MTTPAFFASNRSALDIIQKADQLLSEGDAYGAAAVLGYLPPSHSFVRTVATLRELILEAIR